MNIKVMENKVSHVAKKPDVTVDAFLPRCVLSLNSPDLPSSSCPPETLRLSLLCPSTQPQQLPDSLHPLLTLHFIPSSATLFITCADPDPLFNRPICIDVVPLFWASLLWNMENICTWSTAWTFSLFHDFVQYPMWKRLSIYFTFLISYTALVWFSIYKSRQLFFIKGISYTGATRCALHKAHRKKL